MSLARQEIFGPVLAAIPFDTEEEALKIANDTIYGLAGAVFTKDMDRAHRFSEAIHAGTVWINTYDMSNFATPFGGFRSPSSGPFAPWAFFTISLSFFWASFCFSRSLDFRSSSAF